MVTGRLLHGGCADHVSVEKGLQAKRSFFHNRCISLIIGIDSFHWDGYHFLDLDKFCNIQLWVENIKECVTKSVSG